MYSRATHPVRRLERSARGPGTPDPADRTAHRPITSRARLRGMPRPIAALAAAALMLRRQ